MKCGAILLGLAIFTTCVATSSRVTAADMVVAADGSGQFKTVQAAVDAVPQGNTKPVVISIKPGIYKERVVVPRGKPFIRFLGEDAETTVLTFNLNARMPGEDGKEIGTFRTPSTTIEAEDFSAENITFENSAGPVGQALAIAVVGDRVIFRNCRFLGWQDTLLDQSGRHYYESCYIAGHVDFIFGHATSFFEKCHIHCLRKGYITAADTPEHQKYGYVFSNCKITGESPEVKTYLGRPWRDYANVIFLNTEMSNVVRPEGWHNWEKPHREKTARYAEYGSTGPGANPQARVPWAHQLTEDQAKAITVESVLSGEDGWNPKTGKVNYRLKVAPASASDIESMKKSKVSTVDGNSVYLFTSFRGNGEDGLYLAYSYDGLNWTDLGGPFLKPQVGTGRLMRDPSLLQGPDGTFHLVWTTSWRDDKGFGYASSRDLINWSEQKFVEVMVHEPDAYNVWAPELYYDQENKQFVICWATTIPGNYPEYLEARNSNNHRMYCTTTKNFETFTDTKLFFEPGFSVIDGVIAKWGDRYVLVHKDNTRPLQNLRVAFSDNALGPYIDVSEPFTEKFTEGPSVLQLGDVWVIYFDMYRKHRYGAVKTRDFKTWTDITNLVSFPKDHRHGTVLKVHSAVIERLQRLQSDTLNEPIAPINAPFPMPNLQRPVFPDRVVDIREYGAVADGRTKNTKAFAKAIEACTTAGGGRVLVPAGRWFTGPIHLKSNIELHLAEGAEIIFSDRFEDYLPVVLVRVGGIELYNYSPLIYARDCENIAVTGPGKLNGNAKAWWDAMKGRETSLFFDMGAAGVPLEERVFGTSEAAIRPSFISFVNCRNVLLEGFTIGSGPNWTIHPIYCENVIIRKVNVVTNGPNNDGIDPDSCKNMLIEHCFFDTGDDCVVLKSGYNEDGWRVGRPTENVVMRYCTGNRGHGGLVIGSEMSGDVRNVYMHDCQFDGTDRAIRIKSKRGRGGVVENIWARDLKVENMRREVIIFNMVYGSDTRQARTTKPPIFRNFDIRNVVGKGAPTAILMRALEDSPVQNVKLENIAIQSKSGVVCSNVRNIMFSNVQVTPEQGPVYSVTNGSGITILKSVAPAGTHVFLEVAGPLSSNIKIVESDLSKAETPVSTTADVPESAVVIQEETKAVQ